jgi:hypothetical protein
LINVVNFAESRSRGNVLEAAVRALQLTARRFDAYL